jgi:hypothetical protein
MRDQDLIERLEEIIKLLKRRDRDSANSELYDLFDELEFVSEDYDEDDFEEDEDEEYD